MEKTFNNIDEIIGKHLAGEASPEENVILKTWKDQSLANQKYFDQFKIIFDRAAAVKELQHFNTDAAWNKVRSKLHQQKEVKTIPLPPERTSNFFWRVAASIIVVLGLAFFTYKLFQPSNKSLELVTEKKSETDTLPDGSGVVLNKETKLAYTFDRKKRIHKVRLQGEAYFNIQHEGDKKFIVEAGETLIKDIGTSFNVKAYPESNTIEVVVEEGEVMFYTEESSGIYLHAGGKGIYHKGTKTFTVEEADPNVTAYKTRFFIFSDTDLGRVIKSLNDVYDRKIILNKNLASCRLTVSFYDEKIEEIANIIAETLNLTVKHSEDGNILLEGNSCGK